MAEQIDWLNMSLEDLFHARLRAKEERSLRLAALPFEKKIEIVEGFNAIVRKALEEDEQRRAQQNQSTVKKD